MVFGRKKEASDEGAGAVEAPQAAAARRGRPVPPADRRHLGPGGQHLHQRRLHQLARRQVRQERRLGEAVGRLPAPARASSTRRTASPPTRKGNIYVADRGNRRIQVFDPDGKFLREITIDVPVPPDRMPWMGNVRRTPNAAGQHHAARRAVGHLHHARPDAVSLQRPTPIPGRIYKLTLDGKVAGRARQHRAAS